MELAQIWAVLGIVATTDTDLIRKAYLTRLPECHPETHPEEFKQLRAAYESALKWAEQTAVSGESISQELQGEPSANVDMASPSVVLDQPAQAAQQWFDRFVETACSPEKRFLFSSYEPLFTGLNELSFEAVELVRTSTLQWCRQNVWLPRAVLRHLRDRLHWQQLVDAHDAACVELDEFLNWLDGEDAFDLSSLSGWPLAVQDEVLAFFNFLLHLRFHGTRAELTAYLEQHRVIPLPDCDRGQRSLAAALFTCDMVNPDLLAWCHNKTASAGTENEDPHPDWLALQARIELRLNDSTTAIRTYVRLWRQYRCPEARQEIIACARVVQPDLVPLLAGVLRETQDEALHCAEALQILGDRFEQPYGLKEAYLTLLASGRDIDLRIVLLEGQDETLIQCLYRWAWAVQTRALLWLRLFRTQPPVAETLFHQLIIEELQLRTEAIWNEIERHPVLAPLMQALDGAEPVMPPLQLQNLAPNDAVRLREWLQQVLFLPREWLVQLDRETSCLRGGEADDVRWQWLSNRLARQGKDWVDAPWEEQIGQEQRLHLLDLGFLIQTLPSEWHGVLDSAALKSLSEIPSRHPCVRLASWMQGNSLNDSKDAAALKSSMAELFELCAWFGWSLAEDAVAHLIPVTRASKRQWLDAQIVAPLLLALAHAKRSADPGFSLLAAAVIRGNPRVTDQALKDQAQALIGLMGDAIDQKYLPLLHRLNSVSLLGVSYSFNDPQDPVLNEAVQLTDYLWKVEQGGKAGPWPELGHFYQAWKEAAPTSQFRWLVIGTLLGWIHVTLKRKAREARKRSAREWTSGLLFIPFQMKGRLSRLEFGSHVLVILCMLLLLMSNLDSLSPTGLVGGLLLGLVWLVNATLRRLRDIGYSGSRLALLLGVIVLTLPALSGGWLAFLLLKPSSPLPNSGGFPAGFNMASLEKLLTQGKQS